MRQTSGIIINDDIFINSSNVVKIEKVIREEIINSNMEIVYGIEIYMTNEDTPISLNFKKENDRNVIFNKIVMELYGNNYAHVNF